MLKVSELLGKPLLSLSDAKCVGYVGALWFDVKLTRAKTAEIFSDDDEYPERAFVEMRRMRCEGDAAVIPSVAAVCAQNTPAAVAFCPINRECFNQNGKSLGKVIDILLENNEVTGIVCSHDTFTPKELLRLGENMCIFNDTGAPLRIAKPRRNRPARKNSAAPQPQATPQAQTTPQTKNNAPVDSGVLTPTAPQSVTVTRTPGEPIKDYSFLLGKPVHSPVVQNGRVLIPAGTTVTEEVIELARRENKLVQLALRAF